MALFSGFKKSGRVTVDFDQSQELREYMNFSQKRLCSFFNHLKKKTHKRTTRSVRTSEEYACFYVDSSVTSGRKHVNGVDLYYEQTGRGKHAVLLIPGSLGSVRTDFGPQMKSLNKERFTVVGFDPRGCRQSRPPARDFPLDFLERDAKDAVDLMKALGYDKFSLLGWSAGGSSAMIAAAKNPDVISKMVVWGAKTYITLEEVEFHRALTATFQPSAEMMELYGAEVFLKTWEACFETCTQIAKRPEGSICLELLPLISCPTLIIHGEKDPIVTIQHSQCLLKNIKGSRLHLMPECDHVLHQQNADEFNKLVEDFLED